MTGVVDDYRRPGKPGGKTYLRVLDNEEYCSCHSSPDVEMWEIVEDPTGMAAKALFGGKK